MLFFTGLSVCLGPVNWEFQPGVSLFSIEGGALTLFIKHLLCIRYSALYFIYFIYIILFFHYEGCSSFIRWALCSSKRRNWDLGTLSGLSPVTQLARKRSGIWTQLVWFQSSHPFPTARRLRITVYTDYQEILYRIYSRLFLRTISRIHLLQIKAIMATDSFLFEIKS